jgi:hypothetical protein
MKKNYSGSVLPSSPPRLSQHGLGSPIRKQYSALREVQVGVSVEMVEDIKEQIDTLLINFFGSEEDIRRYGHLFVIEHEEVKMEMTQMADFQGNDFKYRAESRMRIRPKTPQELQEQERD